MVVEGAAVFNRSSSMEKCISLSIIILGSLLVYSPNASAEDKYTDEYDTIDLEEILSSKRLVLSYMHCLLRQGPCSPEGAYLNDVLPDALQNHCSRCTDKQKRGSVKAIKKLVNEYPDQWAQLKVKWDPTGAYLERLMKENP